MRRERRNREEGKGEENKRKVEASDKSERTNERRYVRRE